MTLISPLTQTQTCILAVDDDPMVTSYLEMTLSGWGYRVYTAHDGVMGLAAATKYLPDCILLDLNMPELDGFQFLRHRTKVFETAHIPVIVLSASHTLDDVRQATALGACGYVAKPIDEQILAQRLERIVPSPLFTKPSTSNVEWKRES